MHIHGKVKISKRPSDWSKRQHINSSQVCFPFTLLSNIAQIFSIGFRSGDYVGQGSLLLFLLVGEYVAWPVEENFKYAVTIA